MQDKDENEVDIFDMMGQEFESIMLEGDELIEAAAEECEELKPVDVGEVVDRSNHWRKEHHWLEMEEWTIMMKTMLIKMHSAMPRRQSEVAWRLALLAKYRTT